MPNYTLIKKIDGFAVPYNLTWPPLNLSWPPLNLTWQPLDFMASNFRDSNDTRAALRAVTDYLRATLPSPPTSQLADLRAAGLDLDPATGQLSIYVPTTQPKP